MSRKHIHLIGICGVGMGALAGLFQEQAYVVTGSDRNAYPPMGDQLKKMGIPLHLDYSASNLDPSPDLVVVGNAITRENPEVQEVLARKIPYYSMPQALATFFLKGKIPIVVAGTHGKTTTTGLIAWILESAGRAPSFFVGGVMKNLDRSSRWGKGAHFVLEGDEYNSAFFDKGAKFLHYRPESLLLNPIEYDHADIYKDLPHLMKSFEDLIASLPPSATIIAHAGSPNVQAIKKRFRGRWITFGLSGSAEIGAEAVQIGEKTRFRLTRGGKPIGDLQSPMIGSHNLENLLGASALLLELGLTLEEIQNGLERFQGIRRRQEVVGTFGGVTVLDDFAHHPTAIRETLAAVRARYPQGHLWAIFEPRSHSTRRRIFQGDFPRSFESADEVLIGPIYQAEKIPSEERLDLNRLVREIKDLDRPARQMEIPVILSTLLKEASDGDTICLLSNGDFGGLIRGLARGLKART